MDHARQNAGIVGLGFCVPEKVLNNDDLAKIVDTSDEWIRTRTGIQERHIADEKTATSDLCVEAAQRALRDAGVNPLDVDCIIIATVTPDMAFPSTACLVQARIGAKNAAAFDIEVGCTGFIYGITIAQQFIATGFYRTILVVGAETLSKIIDWTDRATCVLFGDGAGAAVLQPVVPGEGILASQLGADGANGDVLKMPAGGSRMPASHATIEQRLHYVHMSGNDVFKFAVRIMEDATHDILKKAGLKVEDIDLLVPHQANIRIIDSAIKRLGLSEDKVFVNLHRYGNVSSASIPIALTEAVEQGRLKKDDLVVLVGFGAGLTWGSVAMRWCRGGGKA